jgi:hypothetical protein
MAIALFDAELVIARLRSEVTALKKVAAAVDLAAAKADLKNQRPAAWVIELRNQAGPNQVVSIVAQHSVVTFGVLLCVSNVSDARGEAAQAAAKPFREAILAALLGWEPDPGYDVCQYFRGQLIELDAPTLWWMDEIVTGLYLRSNG